ncbi:MAG: hypothetical protein KF903_07280 [Dokdonella sp.]|uniref:BACON domain-containing protein n=1 Tax=Dokdonella sp. TaxID=2291710 RepID=UPI0025C1C3F3|nr:hypothetical protein [Dokdonella sp.]MBX3700789.1 hypothetical protein [Dokdonella sp.]
MWAATSSATIASEDAFETCTTNRAVPGAGDVYLGFVDQPGARRRLHAALLPAAIDDQDSVSWHVNGLPAPPLSRCRQPRRNNDMVDVIDDFGLAGNWLIRATATSGGGSTCTGAVLSWMSASPASGTVNGGASTAVTITVNPAAGSLIPGSYSAELCVTTNDPTQTLVAIPVSVTVTAPPPAFCNGGTDEVFCDGFEVSSVCHRRNINRAGAGW